MPNICISPQRRNSLSVSEVDDAFVGRDNLAVMDVAANYNNTIFSLLIAGVAGDAAILDFGAGQGQFCNRFPSARTTAVEPDSHLRRSIACPAHASLSTVSGTFDLIYALNVLEHIQDDLAVVRALSDRLSPGGQLKILVPARQELFSSMDDAVGHLRRYDRKQLISTVIHSGLRIRDCRYFDTLGYFASLVFKWYGQSSSFNERSVAIYDRLVFPVSRTLDELTGGTWIGKNLFLQAVKK